MYTYYYVSARGSVSICLSVCGVSVFTPVCAFVCGHVSKGAQATVPSVVCLHRHVAVTLGGCFPQ